MVDFESVEFSNVDFSRLRFWAFEASGSRFTACDFRNASLEAGHMGGNKQTVYRKCRFDGASLGKTDAWFARFEQCVFDSAHLDRWKAFNAEFVDCHFAGRVVEVAFAGKPDPKHARWVDPPRAVNEFRGNDFRQAELIECSFFRGIDLSQQFLPEGEEYLRLDRLHERVDLARAEVARWQDGLARQAALSMLKYIDLITVGQDELFAQEDDLPIARDVRKRVWRLLKTV